MKRLSLITLAMLAVIMTGCKEKKTQGVVVEQKALVRTALSGKGDVEQLSQFTGTIQPYVQNVICPSTPVRIDDILVEVGDKVKKDQLLVKMDQTQYRQAAVQLAQLEMDYQRMKSVYDANGISKQQLDAQATQVQVARESNNNLLQNVELRSPINGVVTGRYYDKGDMFSLSPKEGVTGVLTVMQMDKLKIEINISEQYFPNVKLGAPVDITLDIFPDDKFTGKVSLIYPAIDPTTRTFKAEITIPNAQLKLRPGMFSRVALNFGVKERVLMPDLALQRQIGTNEKYVYVINNGVANRKVVNVGRQIGSQYEVIDGIEAGEEVVIAGASRLMDGVQVDITK